MYKYKIILALFLIILLSSCASTFSKLSTQTMGEQESGYTYIPVDPFAVRTQPARSCYDEFVIPSNKIDYNDIYSKTTQELFQANRLEYKPLLESFPDNAVRMSIEQFDTSGNVTYGPVGFGAKNESFRVTVDYVNSDTTNFPVWISKRAINNESGKYENISIVSPVSKQYQLGSVIFEIESSTPYLDDNYEIIDDNYQEFNIPLYVGIGLRITATVDVIGGSANIAGLGVIGAEAELNNLKGALVVQTLGINGKSIASALPIQSELNRTTASNAIVSVGAIKALLYDEKTVISPRVVGLYLPFPGGKPLVNAIISEISKSNVTWYRPCQKIKIE